MRQRAAIPSRNERGRSLTAGPSSVGGLGQGRAIRSSSRQTVEHGPPLEGAVAPETDPPVELHVPDLRTGHLAEARRPAVPRLVLRWGVFHRGAGDHEERDDSRRWRTHERPSGGHWITSSARPSSDGGIVRPRVFAVLRLITNSNFVGCSTGRSAGLEPLRILSTNVAARRRRSVMSAVYASRPPSSTYSLVQYIPGSRYFSAASTNRLRCWNVT